MEELALHHKAASDRQWDRGHSTNPQSVGVSESVLDDVVEHTASASQLQLLTARQREVVQLIAEGYSNITL